MTLEDIYTRLQKRFGNEQSIEHDYFEIIIDSVKITEYKMPDCFHIQVVEDKDPELSFDLGNILENGKTEYDKDYNRWHQKVSLDRINFVHEIINVIKEASSIEKEIRDKKSSKEANESTKRRIEKRKERKREKNIRGLTTGERLLLKTTFEAIEYGYHEFGENFLNLKKYDRDEFKKTSWTDEIEKRSIEWRKNIDKIVVYSEKDPHDEGSYFRSFNVKINEDLLVFGDTFEIHVDLDDYMRNFVSKKDEAKIIKEIGAERCEYHLITGRDFIEVYGVFICRF